MIDMDLKRVSARLFCLRLALLPLLGVAGCADQSALPPARSTGLPFTVNDLELETPNSLPRGFTTNHPMAPDTGIVSVTRTAP